MNRTGELKGYFLDVSRVFMIDTNIYLVKIEKESNLLILLL